MLEQTLEEEKKTDETLTRLANTINTQAKDGEHHATVMMPTRRGGNGSSRSTGRSKH